VTRPTRGRLHEMSSTVTTKQAIEQVMTGKRKPMTVAEIAEAAIPLSNLRGRDPEAGHLLRPLLGEQAGRRARHPHRQGDVQAQPAPPEGRVTAPGWIENADAVRSFAEDVLAAGRDLAAAEDVLTFALWLAELIEQAGSDALAVAVEDGALLVSAEEATWRVVIEPA
jgi:hypothetical protein